MHLLPNHSADELTQALEELSAEIDEWHEVAEQLFVLDEARATLAGAIASKPSQSLEEAVDAMLPIIRAEAGTSMSPYTISGVRVDRIVDANAQGAKRYEVEVNCQKPSMYDKSLYVRSMMEAIERAYGRVVDVERRDGVAPVGLEAAITLLHRANGTLRYSQPAAKHVASLTHLVAKSFDRTNVAYVAQDMHHALCAEFATFMQQEVIAKATSVEHMAAFQAAMGDYSTRTIAQAGMPEGMFLFNDEDIAAFEGDLEKLCSYVEIEIQAFESGDIERLWQEAQN